MRTCAHADMVGVTCPKARQVSGFNSKQVNEPVRGCYACTYYVLEVYSRHYRDHIARLLIQLLNRGRTWKFSVTWNMHVTYGDGPLL